MNSDIKKNNINNGVIERALLIGISNPEAASKDDKLILKLTDLQEKKMMELSETLSLSLDTIVNLAIKYTLFYLQAKNIALTDIKGYPKHLGSCHIKVNLTGKTFSRIQEFNLAEQATECAIIGINLLYKKLLHIDKKNLS